MAAKQLALEAFATERVADSTKLAVILCRSALELIPMTIAASFNLCMKKRPQSGPRPWGDSYIKVNDIK